MLVFPLTVFLFLKFFGENRYTIIRYDKDIFISDSCSSSLIKPGVVKVVILKSKVQNESLLQQNLKRGKHKYRDENRVMFVKYPCLVDSSIIKKNSNIILLDSKGSWRGEYYGDALEEIDRLVVEIDILLIEENGSGFKR